MLIKGGGREPREGGRHYDSVHTNTLYSFATVYDFCVMVGGGCLFLATVCENKFENDRRCWLSDFSNQINVVSYHKCLCYIPSKHWFCMCLTVNWRSPVTVTMFLEVDQWQYGCVFWSEFRHAIQTEEVNDWVHFVHFHFIWVLLRLKHYSEHLTQLKFILCLPFILSWSRLTGDLN